MYINVSQQTINNNGTTIVHVSVTKQFHHHVPYAGHLIKPQKLWLNKIPNECDVVIEFPGNFRSPYRVFGLALMSIKVSRAHKHPFISGFFAWSRDHFRERTRWSGQVVAVENTRPASDRIRFAYKRQTAWDLKIYRTVYKCPVYYVCIYKSH